MGGVRLGSRLRDGVELGVTLIIRFANLDSLERFKQEVPGIQVLYEPSLLYARISDASPAVREAVMAALPEDTTVDTYDPFPEVVDWDEVRKAAEEMGYDWDTLIAQAEATVREWGPHNRYPYPEDAYPEDGGEW